MRQVQGLMSMDNQSLRILQINTFDMAGGAERVAMNLHEFYRSQGHFSQMAVGRKVTSTPDIITIPNDKARSLYTRSMLVLSDRLSKVSVKYDIYNKILRKFRWLGQPHRWWHRHQGHEDFEFPGIKHFFDSFSDKIDIVHCHNLHGDYFDLRFLPYLSSKKPVVLTLHDAWLLSGHCAHSMNCDRWKTGCGHCPDLNIYPPIRRDATHYNWRKKGAIFAKCHLHIAAPSEWLMKKIYLSILTPAIVESRIIPNSVPLHIFKPFDRAEARIRLGINQKVKMILFVANNIRGNAWKDYHTLFSALQNLSQKFERDNILFLGLGENGPEENIGGLRIRFVPFQKDPVNVALYYQAADVYVHAARADTFPNTIIESLACGTPVVASAIGGVPEQVREGETGYLIPPGDGHALARALHEILSDRNKRLYMGEKGAYDAKNRFGLDKQADEYLRWYQKIIQNKK